MVGKSHLFCGGFEEIGRVAVKQIGFVVDSKRLHEFRLNQISFVMDVKRLGALWVNFQWLPSGADGKSSVS